MKKISALSKRPGEPPRHVWVSNNLEALQKAVEGYIEAITVSRGDGRDLVIICNEEGKIRNMEYNATICGEDFVGPILIVGVDGEVTVVDYKSTNNASTHAFVRDVYRFGYFFQSGMYGAGVQANLNLPKLPRFIFIAQEKKPPYSINRIELPEDVILLGYDKFRELIGLYHDCKESGLYFGYNGMFNDLNEAYILEWAKESDEVE